MWHMHVIVGHIWIVLKYWFLPIAELPGIPFILRGILIWQQLQIFQADPLCQAPSEWRTDSIDMTSYLGEDFLSISFRNYGNWSQMLYVDNINLGDQAVAIEAAPLKEWVSCYPNPVTANGQLKISSSTDAPVEFSLFNLNGKLVSHQLINGNDIINIGKLQLSMGTYLYHIKGNGIIHNGKLTVVKTR